MTPVDYVTNATIAAAWDSTQRKKNGQTDISIYNISRNLRYGLIGDILRSVKNKVATPKAVWYADLIETRSKYIYLLLSWIFHYIPAYCLDFIIKILGMKLPPGLDSILDIHTKMDKLTNAYTYFIINEWNFKDNNLKLMINRMSDADRNIYNCDLSNIDYEEYIIVWTLGIRKYIINDGLEGTATGYKKQMILRVVHYVTLAIYIYVFWFIFSTIFMLLKYVLSCFL